MSTRCGDRVGLVVAEGCGVVVGAGAAVGDDSGVADALALHALSASMDMPMGSNLRIDLRIL
jgi:hypothetical protein